jgi:hypothetical protein
MPISTGRYLRKEYHQTGQRPNAIAFGQQPGRQLKKFKGRIFFAPHLGSLPESEGQRMGVQADVLTFTIEVVDNL